MHSKPLAYLFFISLCTIFRCIGVTSASLEYYGILLAKSLHQKESFCITYFPELSYFHHEESEIEFHPLEDETSLNFCSDETEKDFSKKIVVSNLNNCSMEQQAHALQEKGAFGAVFVWQYSNKEESLGNFSFNVKLNITVALIDESSAANLKHMEKPISAKLFSPSGFSFDYSLLIIWVVAVFTVSVGGYWSGYIRHKLYCKETNMLSKVTPEDGAGSAKPAKHANPEESSLTISPYAVGVFVLCIGTTLLLLYFFFDYLVYILIGLFVIVSINSVYACLHPLVMKIFPHCCTLIECHILDDVKVFDPRHLLLLLVSISASVAWVVTRKEMYSWILQDILGILFCINMLKSIRISSFKICALFLTLMFFYDIFFVFITPFLTAEGGSVMEEVATGGKSKEKLPMVLRVPHFSLSPLSVCYQLASTVPFSLLGFGDILVPGLLISYCHGFDLITGGRHRYYALVVATYGIGMILTFVGVNLMGKAQPALLYLVPATIIPPIVLGWLRGELKLLWNGFKCSKLRNMEETITPATFSADSDTANVELTLPSQNAEATTSAGICSRENTLKNENDFMNERKHLLH